MTMACRLKLKHSSDVNDQETRINEILDSLSLSHRKDSTAPTLSGGERKRLSIALELVTNPSIMFLDEPTSGLDEVTAAACIRLLRRLAHEGKTIIATIHQPSAAMFEQFDNIYLLAQGKCVYQGSPRTLIPFLSSENFIIPKYNNPADYSKFWSLADSFHSLMFPISISHRALWSRTGHRDSAIFKNLLQRKAAMRADCFQWNSKYSKLYVEANAVTSYGKHETEWRNLLRTKDETSLEALQKWILAVKPSAILCSLSNDDDKDFPKSTCPLDSVCSSFRLWTLYRNYFL